MATVYSVRFVNNSSTAGTACVYQSSPGTAGNLMSLAWFAHFALPTSAVVFQWVTDYCFVWAETGLLLPGIVFIAAQLLPADLETTNLVHFTYDQGAFSFQDQGPGPAPGSLTIVMSASIPLNVASVGFGMSGAGTFAIQAQPNMTVVITPNPQYWIAFGNYTAGQVLDTSAITNPAQIAFPPGVFRMNATLNQDLTWTISPG